MSIQWTIAAGFLYFEIAIVLLLVLPIASPRAWQRVFKSRFLAALRSQAQVYFYILLFTLVMLLLDAIREMRKYSSHDKDDNLPHHLDHEMQVNMRLFRAQRNFYISGFALFLSLVIKRLVTLVSGLAAMQAQSEASMKQAEGASAAARTLLTKKGEIDENTVNEAHDKQVVALKEEIKNLKEQTKTLKDTLDKEKKDKEALKKQAESTNAEYDRLTSEFSKLQKKVDATAAAGDKKDD